jgi:hypothetical protein
MDLTLAAELDETNRHFKLALDSLEKALTFDMPDLIDLSKRRVILARAASARLRFVDDRLYPTLMAGPTGAHAAAARRLRAEIAALFATFNRHVGVWNTKSIGVNWPRYRAVTQVLINDVRTLFDMERREIYPLLSSALRQRAA